MQGFGNVEAVEQHGSIALGGIAVLVANGAFELAQSHAVFVGHFRLGINAVALFQRGPQRLVAHDHGVDGAIGVEGKLILAQHAQFTRAHHFALLRLQFAGQNLHKGRLAGPVRPGQSVAAPRRKSSAHVFEENLRAVAHGYIADADHGSLFLRNLPALAREPQRCAGRVCTFSTWVEAVFGPQLHAAPESFCSFSFSQDGCRWQRSKRAEQRPARAATQSRSANRAWQLLSAAWLTAVESHTCRT